ncbi:hypothetical protein [Shinella sp.]|uniref:hypothetical protein n=1 Tax=Shinella sp. TaxID=1870904 RepID=UPI002586AFC5|nr:hypothetical protein [Shinella sp.]MCW5711291.1 hypothetical protein [Shinella sp.]
MTKLTELTRLASLIGEKISALPKCDWRDEAAARAYRAAEDALLEELEASEGLRFRKGYDGAAIRIAGISASSTSGKIGALQNWRRGAEKRIAALQAVRRG